MDLITFREFCLSLGEVSEKTPFGKFAVRFDSLLVFYVEGHMFCITDMNDFTSVSIPLSQQKASELEERFSSVRGCMNKALKNWKEIDFNGDISDRMIYDLVREGYEMIKAKYTRRSKK